jgi:prevent-host-death family protein
MITVTLSEAKKKFSALIKRVRAGETVVITLGRNKIPVARLMPIEPVNES